jgi:RimJ/RimL family protein N-acetyltransferase
MSTAASTTIQTDRLLLRLPTADDVAVFDEMHRDPEVMQYLTVFSANGGFSAAWRTVALLIGHWEMLGYGQWVVVDRTSGQTVGRVGLWNPPGWPGLEVSWMIRRSQWGKGLATEAARAAMDHAFNVVKAERVISIIRPDNVRSKRVAAKLGEVFERSEMMDGKEYHIYTASRPGSGT